MFENPSYYAVIPADVRYDDNIPPNAKLLYAEITVLTNKHGYCFASNQYFADLYKVSRVSISRWINLLQKHGYINTELIYQNGTKAIKQRNIYVLKTPINKNVNTPNQKCKDPINKNVNTPINKNVKDNNTSINNTSINTYIGAKDKKSIKKEYPSIQEQIKNFTTDDELIELLEQFIEMRKKLRKPATDFAFSKLLTKLHSLSSSTNTHKEIVRESVINSWQNFYELKKPYNKAYSNKKSISDPDWHKNYEKDIEDYSQKKKDLITDDERQKIIEDAKKIFNN